MTVCPGSLLPPTCPDFPLVLLLVLTQWHTLVLSWAIPKLARTAPLFSVFYSRRQENSVGCGHLKSERKLSFRTKLSRIGISLLPG